MNPTDKILKTARLHNLRALCEASKVTYQRVKNYKKGLVKGLTPDEIKKLTKTIKKTANEL